MSKTIHNKGTKQMFKNPLLEKLTRTHISIPIAIFVLYAAGLLYYSVTNTALNIGLVVALFFTGILFWTLFEYSMHRWFFHMSTHTERRKKLQYTFHGIHHEFPKDKDRLAMPPVLSITIATLLLLLCRAIMGDFTFAFLPGFLVGYAGYLFVHYITHAYKPPKNAFKVLWIHHGIHHYKRSDKAFGVSSPLWDVVFRTMP